MNLEKIKQQDLSDPLANKKQAFLIPQNTIYLDGNSLGVLPKTVKSRVAEVVAKQWGEDLITSWNQHAWIDLPIQVGEKIAALIGAKPGQVISCDSTSVNLFKVLSAALKLNPTRHKVLSTQDNFPTDLYMVQGLTSLLGQDLCELTTVNEDDIEQHLNESVAVLMLTHVNFRTGKVLDMQKLTQLAHDKGILVIWDLAHSAGALPLKLDQCEVDFAVGCGYKYLNGGPGAPAFLYVAERHLAKASQPLVGWMGHAKPFAFSPIYQSANNIEHFQCGTPSVIAMSALDAALEVWQDVDLDLVRHKSLALGQLLIDLVEQQPSLADFVLCSPKDQSERGSQVAFAHPNAFEICQALIAQNVIADFRAPNILRFGLTPLYVSFEDIAKTVSILSEIVENQIYTEKRFNQTQKVT
ncbi:kynureninase [Paraglaciecola aestuariivivens]